MEIPAAQRKRQRTRRMTTQKYYRQDMETYNMQPVDALGARKILRWTPFIHASDHRPFLLFEYPILWESTAGILWVSDQVGRRFREDRGHLKDTDRAKTIDECGLTLPLVLSDRKVTLTKRGHEAYNRHSKRIPNFHERWVAHCKWLDAITALQAVKRAREQRKNRDTRGRRASI